MVTVILSIDVFLINSILTDVGVSFGPLSLLGDNRVWYPLNLWNSVMLS